MKFMVPLLVTVPLLVKLPRILCVGAPPLKIAPLLILNATPMVQFTLGFMPAVLLTFRVANMGELVEFSTGETFPLKLIIPLELEVMAFKKRMVCTTVPVKVVVPLLIREPLLVRSPLTVAKPEPPS
jgi:hypothetical protein